MLQIHKKESFILNKKGYVNIGINYVIVKPFIYLCFLTKYRELDNIINYCII